MNSEKARDEVSSFNRFLELIEPIAYNHANGAPLKKSQTETDSKITGIQMSVRARVVSI